MKRSLKIGILGTRGIPNRYGGFEQCAEYLALGLTERGYDVWVYNAHNHEYTADNWNGVHIIHCNDPEHKMGTAGQFIYDLNCLRDAKKRKYDVLLQLGYTSNSLWYRLWPRNCRNIVNMDGLEWKRSKYSKNVQRFLKNAERWAAKRGDVLIADSIGIQQHLLDTYNKQSVYIPYGAEVFDQPDKSVLQQYGLEPYRYNMLIARMEPENNIEMIIEGSIVAADQRKLMVVGKTTNAFGTYLVDKYGKHPSICFLGGIYDIRVVNNLRYYSSLYFHGHSVGGTNPSLLEAMASSALIAAHGNVFNKAILEDDALYFTSAEDVAAIIRQVAEKQSHAGKIAHNLEKVRSKYNWQSITDQYEQVFLRAVGE